MSVNVTYDFSLMKVHADVYVEKPIGSDKPLIFVPPICLMKDAGQWEVIWEIKLGSGVSNAEFVPLLPTGGIVFEASQPDGFKAYDSHADANDSRKWTVTCESQVDNVGRAPYHIYLTVNNQTLRHDPSIAVTTDPIPPKPYSMPWPGGEGAEIRLAAQRVEER